MNRYFDKVYIINLPERKERLQRTIQELTNQGFTEYEVFKAIQCSNGRLGIYLTFYKLIEQAYFAGYESIAVFEDDVQFVSNFKQWYYIENNGLLLKCRADLYDHHIIYLGCNSHDLHENRTPFSLTDRRGILKANDVWACHAMIISRAGMYEILKAINKDAGYKIQEWDFSYHPGGSIRNDLNKTLVYSLPLDVLIQQKVQPLGKCYAANPMLCIQHSGYSDIEKKDMQQDYLLQRFNAQVQKLNT